MLPITELGVSTWSIKEGPDGLGNFDNGTRCQRDRSNFDVHPESDDLECDTIFLLLIFPRAINCVPEDE